MINSILDTDLYKLTMQMAVAHHFPKAKVSYYFINRGDTVFPDNLGEELKKQVKLMENLFLSTSEKEYLKTIYFLSPIYIDFLAGYRYDSSEVTINQIPGTGKLEITIEGYWYRTILWEVPLLAMISELYYQMKYLNYCNRNTREKINLEKAKFFKDNGIKVADFGTRRRFSFNNQWEVLKDFTQSNYREFLVGTSNVYFAMNFGIPAIGTHAHEWFMFHAAKYGYKMANTLAMEHWSDIFRGDLGIALSDTFTTDSFLNSFDRKFAKLYDGVRQDSGDPFIFANKIINHYKKLGIDPASKTIVFSDSLNPEAALAIQKEFYKKIKCSFGIGTNLTNDVGLKPLNIVIKLVKAKPDGDDWHNVIKLSDSVDKHTGDLKEIEICKHILNIKLL